MANPSVLAIDLGTTNLKLGLVDIEGTLLASAERAVETLATGPDLFEQDPVALWDMVVSAAASMVREAGGPASDIRAVQCSSQFFSLIPVDERGAATSKMKLWMSRRGAPYAQKLLQETPDALLRFLDIHGAIPFGNDSLSHALYLREECPDVWARTRALLEPADFLTLKFSGQIATNLCSAFPLMLTDNRSIPAGTWSPELLKLAGVSADHLAPMHPVEASVGPIKSSVAQSTGLPENIPIFGGINDTQAVTMGAGAFRPGHGGLNIGTTIQVLGNAPSKMTDIESQTVSMPSPLPGEYMAMGECGLGGRLLEHYLHNLVHAEDHLADHRSSDPFAALERAVAAEPAGSGKLLYLPWLSGAMAPLESANARGGFLNMNLGTTRPRMLRSVLEGIGFQLRWMQPYVEKFSQQPWTTITFSGGGARSPVWAGILADILDRPIHRIDNARQTNTRGAAFLAFLRLGLLDRDALDDFRPIAEIHQPQSAHRRIYDGLFNAWQKAFEANAPVFDLLQSLETETTEL
ncbi:MAG: FGGY-family carbohydrate kinase [Candidatus Binatia bacterium]|nr:FGGY-family carbohydrate kinase [Candidatus Binatia bacterium]MDG1958553.1 FGGY-family carbohydrate kinase [Candidatus Binatia bacterium]MDG2009138.1 FGGY-family carbohydrate kinase [Candidatus Binatia bacterium]HAC81038.1 carbohydrate kinase [Deltaproteobacteria bacterium]